MSYTYAAERPKLFTEDGQRSFLVIRDEAQRLLREAGAFRLTHLLDVRGADGDSWFLLAAVDRLVELGEIREVTAPNCSAQHRVFVGTRS